MDKTKFAKELLDVTCKAGYLADLSRCLGSGDYSDSNSSLQNSLTGAFSAICMLSDMITSDLCVLEECYHYDNNIPYGEEVTANV